MVDFRKLFTVKSGRDSIIPPKIVCRILLSPLAQKATAPVLEKWYALKQDLMAFTVFLKSINVDTNIIGALKAWIQLPNESRMSFLEFLLQPQYHHHFSALLGEESIYTLNKEIDLRGYLHEMGVLCSMLKAYRVGSRDLKSDVDVLCEVDQDGQDMDPADKEKLYELYGANMSLDLTLYTLSPDGLTVTWTNKGHLLVVWWLLSCNSIMLPLTPGQLQELLQVRITGFWALLACHFDLIPFLVHSGKSKEEAQAILQRGQEETLTLDDMVALVKAFRTGRITIPAEPRIREKWLKALNSLIKQYLHITALINGHNTADKDVLIQQLGVTADVLSFLRYIMYHGNDGSLKQEGVSGLLCQMLDDASMFTELTLEQGPMWKVRLWDYARRIAKSKGTTAVQGQGQTPVSLTVDILYLIFTQKPDHPIVKWFIAKIREVKEKREKKHPLSDYETSLMGIAKLIKPETTDEDLLSILLKDLKKIIPDNEDVLKTIPPIFEIEVDRMKGKLMSLDGVDAQCILYGDIKSSIDIDACVVIILNASNHGTYIFKTPSGLYASRPLSSAITRGGDVSTLILMNGEGGKLFPVEIKNFYVNEKGEKVYVTAIKDSFVDADGLPVPQGVEIYYELLPTVDPKLLERHAILSLTGIMDKEFKERLSQEPLNYTRNINIGKWHDLGRYLIRWVSDRLTELSVLLHILRTIKAPQSLIVRIEALKLLRDNLFKTMPHTDAIPQEFMQDWAKMLQEVFALGLHTPDVLAFIQKNGDINGLTKDQTDKIMRYLQTMYMDRLTFFKAIVFRLCQIMYGLFVCIPENKHMNYVKSELAEKVLPVLHKMDIEIPIDTLVALLHRNYSLPSDVRFPLTLHDDFEKFVLRALAVLFPRFTGQEFRQMEKGEPVSWNLIVPDPKPVQETLVSDPDHDSVLVPTSAPELVDGTFSAFDINELYLFVQKAKDRNVGKPWHKYIAMFIERYNKGHVDGELVATLMKIAKCDDILKAIANVAKSVNNGSQPQRIEALIVLTLVNYFGHGQESFVKSIVVDKGAYDPREDIKALRERINALNKSSQALAPASAHALAPVHASLYDMYRKEVYAGIKKCMRGLGIIAVFDDSNSFKKVIVVVQNDDVFHISPLPEGTLCIMSYTHPALSKELLSSMTHRLTTPNFQILGTIIPETTIVPFAMTKKQLTYQELHIEVVSFLAAQGIHFLSILRFGSSLQHAEEKRPMERDVDYRVLITEGERKGFEFTASDGTICDLSFTTMDNAKTQHEVLIAMLLGSSWMDASGNKVEPFGVPSTLKESLQMLLPVVGRSIHYNGLKGKDDPVKTFQSIQLMVIMMLMVVNHNQYPRYDPLVFFPEGFNKDAFVQFLKTSTVDCAMIVDLFTRAQYMVSKDGLKAQESKYASTLEALPAPLKQLMITFKKVTTTSFPNLSDKKSVSGVRSLLEWISK